ncbi:hypothetical protein EN930_34815, partial [Mesorhizobium sp. M7A.F.Ca.CA.004.11.2.1]
ELPKTPSGKIQRFLLRKAEVEKRKGVMLPISPLVGPEGRARPVARPGTARHYSFARKTSGTTNTSSARP